MNYSEFFALADLSRNPDVEVSYKDNFTHFEFTLKSTAAINGDGSLYVLKTTEDSVTAIAEMLEKFDIVYYNPTSNKFLFVH